MAMSSAVAGRLPALSGVAFVVLTAAGMLLGDPWDPATDPNPGRPADALAAALEANRGQARLGAYLTLAGVFFLFWFVAYLYRLLREVESDGGWFAGVALGGGLVTAAVLLMGASMGFAASELANFADDPQVAKTFFVWGWNASNIAGPPLIALVTATTLVAVRHRRFPRWFRVFGVVWTLLLVALLVGNMAGLGAGLAMLWVLAGSLVLLFDPTAAVVAAPVQPEAGKAPAVGSP